MTLTELLVGASVMTLVSGAALSAVLPLQRAFAAQPEASSLTQRSRVVAEMLSGDLRRATLVLPLRAGDIDNDIPAGVFYRPDIVTVLTDPVDALSRGLVTPSDSRTYHLKQDSEGIWQLMQYDGRASDQPAVEDVTALTFEYFGEAEPPLPLMTPGGEVRVTYGAVPPPLDLDDAGDSWGPGENCSITILDGSHAPRLRSLGAPGVVPLASSILVDGPWCPDAGHAFRFDADLLRVRRVRVRVRLQAARPFRGLAGAWFSNPGSAGDSSRFVQDETVVLEIAPRNVHAAR
jgi:hypothetical protein